jgi:hypothetical protein
MYSELGTPWSNSIWETCIGLAGQVHYTLPMGPSGKPTSIPKAFNPSTGTSNTINMTYTEEWVQTLLSDAYRKSPMYWHHSTRHVPSQSSFCSRPSPRSYSPLNKAQIKSNNTPSSSSSSSATYSIPTYGWSSMTLGGDKTDCYCGWWYNTTHCKPPSTLCTEILNLAYSSEARLKCPLYAAGEFDMRVAIRQMLKIREWDAIAWQCPSLSFSDHWGFLGMDTTTTTTTSSNVINNNDNNINKSNEMLMSSNAMDRVLFRGPSGARLGGLSWMLSNTTNLMEPTQQQEPPPEPLQCSMAPSQSLVNHFIDDLFPAMQGVRQSAPVSYCMRFVIELARLNSYNDAGLTIPIAEQQRTVATWRKRCNSKLQQITLCETYGVFHITGKSSYAIDCPFAVVPEYEHIVTPSCIVLYQDVAYDPCLCNPAKFCTAAAPNPTTGVITKPVLIPPTDLSNKKAICAVPHPRDIAIDLQSGLTSWPPPPPSSSSSASNASVYTVPSILVRDDDDDDTFLFPPPHPPPLHLLPLRAHHHHCRH